MGVDGGPRRLAARAEHARPRRAASLAPPSVPGAAASIPYARRVSDEARYVRAPVVRIVDRGASTTVIGREVARRFDGDSAELLRAVLDIHALPTSRARLLAELAARAAT